MINALNNTAATTRRNVLLATAGAGMAILFSACGGQQTEITTATELPAPVAAEAAPVVEEIELTTSTEPASAPATETVTTVTAEASAPSVETETVESTTAQLIPASSPDLPCETYTEVTEFPVFACSTGPLVADFQSWVAYTDPDFLVDGQFGTDTLDAVIAFQAMYGLEQTGVIDEALMAAIHGDHDESGHDTAVDIDLTTDQMIQYCTELAGGLWEDVELTTELIIECDSLDIRLTSGD